MPPDESVPGGGGTPARVTSDDSPVLSVLIADTQPLFAEALGCALDDEEDLKVIAEFPDRGLAAVDAVRRHRPDVVVYDHWMLEIDGPTATRAIQCFAPATKVLVASWYHGTPHIQAALAAGAVGFLPKSLSVAQVADAVRRAGADEPLVFAEQLAGLVDGIEARYDASVARSERLDSLSRREIEVLRALAEGRTLSAVAQQLSISVGTAKNHVCSILAKTGARSQTEAVAIARRERFVVDARPGRTDDRADAGRPQQGVLPPASSPAPGRRARGDGGGRISVVVADSQRLFADALASGLAHDPRLSVLATPTRAGEAIDAVLSHRPDVAVYDLHLRDMEGTAAVRALARWAPATRVIFVSWYHGRPAVRKALAAVPDLVVPKTASLATVCEAVRRAGEREAGVHAADIALLLDLLDGEHPGDDRLDRLLTLSPREVQVLQLVANGKPTKEMASELCLAVGTVKNLSHRLMAKLGVSSRLEAVAMARDKGFLS